MKLRKLVASAAVGAAVLTAVPAITGSYTAYACDDTQSDCTDDPYTDPWDDPYGDPSGGDGGSGSDINISEGEVGQPVDATLPPVIITGKSISPPTPMDPNIPTVSWGGGGGGGGTGALVVATKDKSEARGDCIRNATTQPVTLNQSVKYNVSYQVSANLSANAAGVLSAGLGVQLNTSLERSYNLQIVLNPGQTVALFVQYQTNTYAVTSSNLIGYTSTEYADVVQPTGVVTLRAC